MEVLAPHIESLKELCETHHVAELYIFGSVLTSDYTEKSDIDFLVRFKPIELSEYFDNYIDLKERLTILLGRDIDLIEEQTLKNPILIDSINRSKELVYG